MYEFMDLQTNLTSRIWLIDLEIVYIMCTDCQDLQKMLNIQNCVNLTGNCIHQMYEFSGFVENSTSRIA